jgi:hypothetical protein
MTPETGSPDFVSFTDGTSLPYTGSKVSIQAQIQRDEPMPWLRVIEQSIHDDSGELKSIPGVKVFFGLSGRERGSILPTLRKVRIHIVDPRTYYDTFQSALRPILPPGMTALSFLSRLDSQQPTRRIQEMVRQWITEDIVRDSPAERLKRENELLECLSGRRIPSWIPIPPDMQGMFAPPKPSQASDVSRFEKPASNMVNQAVPAVAKSASVFSEALEMVTGAINRSPARSRALLSMSLLSSLSARRAFDDGERDDLKFIREQRSQVFAELSLFPWNAHQQYELEEVDSADSREIQAADIAAGITRELWYRDSLVNLVRHFDCVFLNGMRLSETTAAAHPYSRPRPH